MNNNNSHYTLTDSTVLMAACIVTSMGALVFNALPLFLSATANQFGMDEAQLGLLGTTYLLSFAAVALFAPIWMSRLEWRSLATGSLVLISVALAMQLFTEDLTMIYATMGAIGVGSSITFTIGLTIVGRAVDPERAFGINLMYQMGIAGVLMFAMMNFIILKFGFTGYVVGSALTYAAALLVCSRLPANFMKSELANSAESGGTFQGSKKAVWLAIFALAIQFAAFAAVWGFMERIGVDNGLDAAQVGVILFASIIAGFGGALLAAAFGNKYGHVLPLAGGLILTIVAVLVLAYSKGLFAFIFGACVINGMLQFTIAYQMGLIAHTDYNGKFTVMIPFILAFFGAFGPGIAGEVVKTSGFGPVYVGFAVIAAISISTTVWVGRLAPVDD
jgi:predicted MFS family arabinose efflux permease